MATYKEAGVNKEEGYKAVSLMKKAVAKTQNASVLNGLGSFGALYALGKYEEPVLVSGTDGVGTKLEIALRRKKYATVGIDCVAMCVNDILCQGAKPLFFLDYLACGHLEAEVAAELVSGIAEGCLQSEAALVGGETAEMPGFYKEGDYDMAGFAVGVVEKAKLIDGSKVREGDVILALPSSGFHSNGFSLIRKVFSDYEELYEGKKIGEVLLEPTKIYVKEVLPLLDKFDIHGLAHITGGGLPENLPRAMGEDFYPLISKSKLRIPKIFKDLKERGGISEEEMFGSFNMGVGFCLIVPEKEALAVAMALPESYEIGRVKKGGHALCFES